MSKKIKLLAVIHSLEGGGTEKQFLHIVRNLDREKFDIAVCLFSKKGVYVKNLPNDIRIYDFRRTSTLSLVRIIWQLRKVIKAESPQLIYSRHWKPNIITVIAKLLARSDVRVVITEVSVLSHALAFNRRKCKPIITMFVKWCYPLADRVVAVSQAVNSDLVKNFGLSDKKVTCIPNMVDIDHIKNELSSSDIEESENERDFTVTSVGRLGKEKGFKDLIEAVRIVNKDVPCRLEIFGEGPEAANLQELAVGYGLIDKVKFRGFREDPFKIIKNSDVFVMASLFEGLPGVLLEAMAVGVPVIFTDVGGVRDVAEDGKEILIVPVRSPEVLAEKIIFLSKNPEYCKELAENARKRVTDFSVEIGIKKFEDLFLSLCR